MSQDIVASVSDLSLDNAEPEVRRSAKSKRPTRAFHSFAGNAAQASPTTNMYAFQANYQTPKMNDNAGVFTPKNFNGSKLASPAPMASPGPFGMPMSPAPVGSPRLYGADYGNPNAAPDSTSSYIIPSHRWEEQNLFLTKAYDAVRDVVPPLPTTQYYASDNGICDPRLMQLSMNMIPSDQHIRSATKLPLGVTIQPFATTIPNEVPSSGEINGGEQQVQGSAEGPMRCKRCRCYINPKFQFTYDSKAVCNICQIKQQAPYDYSSAIGPNGQRTDAEIRPELSRGAVDFIVPMTYNRLPEKATRPLHYVFLIDVSTLANENGSSLAVVDGIRSSIDYIIENQPKCKVAIIAYDNKLKFFNLKPELETAQEYDVNELDDVFLPFYQGLFVNPSESKHVIDDTLNRLSSFITNDKYYHVPQVCFGSAVQAAELALETFTEGEGGKIICSLNSLPTVGNGNLYLRKDNAHLHHIKCDNDFYKKLTSDLMTKYIAIDLFVTSGGFVDMANVGHPTLATHGSLKYYPHFVQQNDEFKLVNDMVSTIANTVGYQGILKLRCSTGLAVDMYYNEATGYSDRDVTLPILTKDTTIDVLLKYQEKLKSGTSMSFQAALLYTDVHGVRKVRSLNSSALVSSNVREIFKRVNQNSVLRIMIKDVIRTLGDCDFPKIRKSIDNKLVDILTQYRGLVSGNSSSQLVLPESLKTLPSYMLSFQKQDLMVPNQQSTRGNDRMYDLIRYQSMSPAELLYKLYPQIVPLHVLLEEQDLSFYDANDKLLQVEKSSLEEVSVRNMHANFTDGGCYLIFNGDRIFLWFNPHTNRLLIQDLLGIDPDFPINQITLFGGVLPETSTEINGKVLNLIKYWGQMVNKTTLPVIPLRPNIDQYYSYVMGHILCEDKSINMVESGDNYILSLHRQIQEKIKKEDYIKISNKSQNDDIHQKFVQF
ncbi:SED5-binding protein 3 [Nakaseomyces bracarensis]|uniref:SED5-binding protein 3 n=1 Tax=Nakaseomyces bracarensis TaxID=273131 RepID=A0ABR4NS47_9SACH